jgi:hypothetical protein
MPSGYTYRIVEGEQTFQDFVWRAVRAMGVFIHMRDDCLDAPLRMPEPDFIKRGSPSEIGRREAELRRYETELHDEQVKTPEQIAAEFEAYKAKRLAEYEETYARRKPIYERVTRLRSEVSDWKPPTEDHENFKRFMLEQLDETTKWDAELPEKPVFKETAEEWHADEIEWLEGRIARCEELLQEEINSPDIRKGHIQWLEELMASVPPPPGRFKE